MLHKFYNSNNVNDVFLSPYCKVIENTEQRICILNHNTNQIVVFRGAIEAMDAFRKSFLLNMGMKYEDLCAFFSKFDNCSIDTWQDLIQGGFLE